MHANTDISSILFKLYFSTTHDHRILEEATGFVIGGQDKSSAITISSLMPFFTITKQDYKRSASVAHRVATLVDRVLSLF